LPNYQTFRTTILLLERRIQDLPNPLPSVL
jgi:hypothetical protein